MTIDTDQWQLCVTRSHNLLLTLAFTRVVGLWRYGATPNYNLWAPIVTTVAIRSHNCLLTPIVEWRSEGSNRAKMAGCNCEATE